MGTRGRETRDTENTGLTVLPPPERCVPHRTQSNGEGGWALWRPQGTRRQDRTGGLQGGAHSGTHGGAGSSGGHGGSGDSGGHGGSGDSGRHGGAERSGGHGGSGESGGHGGSGDSGGHGGAECLGGHGGSGESGGHGGSGDSVALALGPATESRRARMKQRIRRAKVEPEASATEV